MSRSREKRRAKANRKTSVRSSVATAGKDRLLLVLQAVVPMLLVARWLVPTEASVQGETLWMVQLWLAAGFLWALCCLRRRDFRVRVDRLDVLLKSQKQA